MPSSSVHDIVMEIIAMLMLMAAGAGISTLGALAGLGGGFLAVPFLMLLWNQDKDIAVLTSLTMILANSTSSSITYLRSKMVDLKIFALLIIPTIPGLFLGWWLLGEMNDNLFRIIFSILMVIVMIYVLIRNRKGRKKWKNDDMRKEKEPGGVVRILSVPIAFLAGTASSAFGIGGGALLMPLQVGLLKVAVKRSIATSMFLIAVMSAIRVIVISGGAFDPFVAIPLALGGLLGAQLAAYLVKRLKSAILLYFLASFLFFIAIYMGIQGLISII
jgi:uncharacterized membrane protein YfcA